MSGIGATSPCARVPVIRLPVSAAFAPSSLGNVHPGDARHSAKARSTVPAVHGRSCLPGRCSCTRSLEPRSEARPPKVAIRLPLVQEPTRQRTDRLGALGRHGCESHHRTGATRPRKFSRSAPLFRTWTLGRVGGARTRGPRVDHRRCSVQLHDACLVLPR